jgi:hypothetical protein
MMRTLMRGALAGAAGTTVLNSVTYGDMALRGRPASSTPEATVEALARRAGIIVDGTGETRAHRLTGLAALSGIATGVGVGSAVSVLRRVGVRPPLWVGGVFTGVLAMAVTDLSMAELKVSDPRTWSSTDWLSDAIPHLLYGLATYSVVTAVDRRS